MRKIYLYALLCVGLTGIISCSGNKQKRIQTFAETFTGYLKSNQMDSVKAVHPSANFDSVAPIKLDSIQIIEKDGNYRVIFGGTKWIDVKENEEGDIIVENSKGIAAFPKDKYDIALKTGMFNDSTADTKAYELLKDTAYFTWINNKVLESADKVFSVKTGKVKVAYYGEGDGLLTLPITIQNNLPTAFKGDEYYITYTLIYYAYLGHISPELEGSYKRRSKTVKIKGEDIGPNKSINMNIKQYGDQIINVKATPKLSLGQSATNFYKPSGKEYQEYLDSKK